MRTVLFSLFNANWTRIVITSHLWKESICERSLQVPFVTLPLNSMHTDICTPIDYGNNYNACLQIPARFLEEKYLTTISLMPYYSSSIQVFPAIDIIRFDDQFQHKSNYFELLFCSHTAAEKVPYDVMERILLYSMKSLCFLHFFKRYFLGCKNSHARRAAKQVISYYNPKF